MGGVCVGGGEMRSSDREDEIRRDEIVSLLSKIRDEGCVAVGDHDDFTGFLWRKKKGKKR